MGNLLIAGSGGHGQVTAEAALESGIWDRIAFVDNIYDQSAMESIPLLGKIDAAQLFINEYTSAIIALGDNQLRMYWLEQFESFGFNIISIIHPKAYVSKYAEIGKGTVVMPGAVVNPNSTIGKGCIINTLSSVDHGCKLGDGVHISPGAHLAGDVEVGQYTWIGLGASIINKVKIGANVIVGAGSVILTDIEDSSKVVGVPGRVINLNVIEKE